MFHNIVFKEYFLNNYKCINIDGVRIEYENGWGLVRSSNTQPVIVCRFEASTTNDLDLIQKNVINKLKDQGIETGVMWPMGCHTQPSYNSNDMLKSTEYATKRILSLPCWPYMTEDEVAYVIENVNKII